MHIEKNIPRILLIAAGLLLLVLFVVPMWRITLEAPQYPDGVTMFIHINEISGSEEGTLQNINILNHYIGMKPIEPNSIPELKWFPKIIVGFVAVAILFALLDKKVLYWVWPVLFLVAMVLGMYDFYLWEFDYGHDLDPNAPMKFDVDSYQPPLFGTKTLLNFIAKSYPSTGAYAMILSLLLATFGAWKKLKKLKIKPSSYVIFFMIGVTFLGCQVKPKDIEYGSDQCHYCKMIIADQQFAAEVVTTKGKVYLFDAIECMVPYVQKRGESAFKYILVNDYMKPGSPMDARMASYIQSRELESPMGGHLAAFSNQEEAENRLSEFPGDVYSWKELLTNVKLRWP